MSSFGPEPANITAGEPVGLQPEMPAVRSKFQNRTWLHASLFVFTLVTTTLVGADHYASFISNFGAITIHLSAGLLIRGLWYSVTILAILGTHELGHYLACRVYNVDASLPYFLPLPPLLPIGTLTGTLGAVIRIREPIRMKRALFDIGIAGPIAGFLIAVPALFLGVSLSTVAKVPPHFIGFELGEPLLFRLASHLVWGSIPDGQSLNLHPVGFAAWFGLLATALNLFPIGQLDGGHISYAVLGRRSTVVTLLMIATALGLTFLSLSWLFYTVLMVAMLFFFGPRHPRTLDEHEPLDRPRVWLAVGALIMFIVCFTPVPLELVGIK